MAEIIGTAASVLQVAEAGFSLATTLYNYAQSVRNAERDVKKIARDVTLTAKVLKTTHEQLKEDTEGRVVKAEAIHDLEEVLEGCKEAFKEVDDALTKSMRVGVNGKPTISRTEKLKWPLRSSKLEVLRANLERLKSTLVLMLSVLTYGAKISQAAVAANMQVKVELTLDRLKLEEILQARNDATQRYEALRKRFEELEIKVAENSNGVSGAGTAIGGGVNSITAFTLPGADNPQTERNDVARPTRIDSNDSVGTALDKCASTVSNLTKSIQTATKQWRTQHQVDQFFITSSLEETTEAIGNLGTKISEHNARRTEPTRSRFQEPHAERAAWPPRTFSERKVIVKSEVDFISVPSSSSRHGSYHLHATHNSPPAEREPVSHPQDFVTGPIFSGTGDHTSEIQSAYGAQLPSHWEHRPTDDTGVEEELLADDDGMDLDLGAEEELETVECEEEEAEEEEEQGEEDLEPEDAVEQLLQRWTGLVGI